MTPYLIPAFHDVVLPVADALAVWNTFILGINLVLILVLALVFWNARESNGESVLMRRLSDVIIAIVAMVFWAWLPRALMSSGLTGIAFDGSVTAMLSVLWDWVWIPVTLLTVTVFRLHRALQGAK